MTSDKSSDAAHAIACRTGSLRDYDRLAALHYRASRPATCAAVWVACAAESVVGVLVVSMPALNGPWRAAVWPRECSGCDKRRAAAALNDAVSGVRCISRLIVDPRYRGLGVGSQLVRWYLSHALTTRTESIAAMGAACPVFERGGMRRVDVSASARDERLLRALRRARIRPWELVDVRSVCRCVRADRELQKALRVWADASRGTRRLKDGAIAPLVEAAAAAVGNGGGKVVYVWEKEERLNGDS